MSAIRDYLEAKAALSEKEWLRRKPRETHPEILALVRDFRASVGDGTPYDDDAEQYVEAAAGDLPEHRYHAHPERHRLTEQLGAEVYLAQCLCRDEEHQAALDAALADGFKPIEDVTLREGTRYLVRFGILYSGYSVPVYGEARLVRAVKFGEEFAFLPPRARTHGFAVHAPALIREEARA